MTMAQSKARGSRQKPKHDRKPRAPRAPSVSDTFHAPRTPRKRRQGAGRRKPAELDTIVPYDSLAGLSPLTDPPSPLPEAYAPNVTPGHPAPDTTRADDTPRHNCSVVDTELKEARAHVAELTMRIQDRAEADDVDVELNDQLQSLTAEVWTLKRRLEETTTELLTATTDLALLREWTTFKSEDNTALLNLFDDINDKISEAAYQFVDMLDIRYDDTVQAGSFGVCLDDPDNTDLGQRTLNKFLQHCVTKSLRTRYALRQVIRAILYHALAKHIFHQFTPGLDSNLNKFLTDICSHLSREEMQTTSGMWRALAYSNPFPNDGRRCREAR
ncbi:hypothetical protein EXIGLDRAFT_747403 [Exidia glandulosa HHB12029]|uniref:Uncharacterized protein n=1 Tax=Exidia glandulosa HHB12029 TaxID=1314781 RepID=A0A165KTX0_EXIGL|nr:hypothetical protein EXIGLDRAFT_747403 [Exidia glandulosa HHB12029]